MNCVSFSAPDGTATWGVAGRGTVHDLGPSGKGVAPSLRAVVVEGVSGRLTPDDLTGAPAHDV